VLRHSIKLGFAAVTLAIGVQAGVAQAAFNGSALAQAAAEQATVVDTVRWVCIGNRCDWVPGYRGRLALHPWAVWGAPRLPTCYFTKVRGAWVEVC
jgi:hypothetical protein